MDTSDLGHYSAVPFHVAAASADVAVVAPQVVLAVVALASALSSVAGVNVAVGEIGWSEVR